MVTTRKYLLNKRLKLYVEAEEKVLAGQSYTIGNRTLTRADLSEIRKAIDDLIADGAELDGCEADRTRRTKRVVFIN